MQKALQIIAGAALLALGIWIGTLFSGCNGKSKVPIVYREIDTLVIDTSKIIYKTPIVIQQVQAAPVNQNVDCWNSFPVTVNAHGDTLSIDSVNSCKGDYRGIHMSYRPDTITYTLDGEIVHDTIKVEEPFKLPSWAEAVGDVLGFNITAKAGSGFGMVFGTGVDLNLNYGRIGLNVSPSLYYLDKFRGFVFIGATYKILGK